MSSSDDEMLTEDLYLSDNDVILCLLIYFLCDIFIIWTLVFPLLF